MKIARVELVHHLYTSRRKGTGPDSAENWFVRVIAKNGQTLLTSETYTSKVKAKNVAVGSVYHFGCELREIELLD